MRILLLVLPTALALGLLSACGGCGHGPHNHPTGQSWEQGAEWEATCTCTDDGIECDDGSTARNTSGGMVTES